MLTEHTHVPPNWNLYSKLFFAKKDRSAKCIKQAVQDLSRTSRQSQKRFMIFILTLRVFKTRKLQRGQLWS